MCNVALNMILLETLGVIANVAKMLAMLHHTNSQQLVCLDSVDAGILEGTSLTAIHIF